MSRGKRGFTLVELLVVISIIGVLVSLLLPAVQAARSAARRVHSVNNVKQLVLAVHGYHDAKRELPHNGNWVYGASHFAPPNNPNPPRPEMAEGCSWVYKILPYFEQQNLYDNFSFDVSVPTLMDPGRPGTGISVVPYDLQYATVWGIISSAGAVTDYAANSMVIGNVMIMEPSGGCGINKNWTGPPRSWISFDRQLGDITDGSAYTILIGSKALPVQAYDMRGGQDGIDFTMSNGSTRSTFDSPITGAGHEVNGLVRGISPDTAEYLCAWPRTGSIPWTDYVPGQTYGIRTGFWKTAYRESIEVVTDALDLDAWNRWGSPYQATPIAMADGSVKLITDGTGVEILGPYLTPQGEEIVSDDF